MSNGDRLHHVAVRGCLIAAILAVPVVSHSQETVPEISTPNEEGKGLAPNTLTPQEDTQEQATENQEPVAETGENIAPVQSQKATEPTCDARCEAAEQREKDSLMAQESMARSAEASVDHTWWQLGVGTAGITLLFLTLYYTRQSTRAAITAAGAAIEATKITEKALTGLEVPHLFVNAVRFDQPLIRESFDYQTEQRYPWVHYSVKNYGRSPAIVKEFCAQVWVGTDISETPEFRESDSYGQDDAHVLGTGESHTYQAPVRFPIDGKIMNDLGIGTQRLRFFGYIKYESLFGQAEKICFCWRYNLDLAKFFQESLPNYTYRNRGNR